MPWQVRTLLAVCALGVGTALVQAVLAHGWVATLAVLSAAVALLLALGEVEMRRMAQRLRALAASRAGEDIGHFARQANCRVHDAWVVRAVYETLAQELAACARLPHFAPRWDDDLWRTLRLDEEDMDMALLPVMAARAGRSLRDTSANPWHGRVRTVGDLVRFLCAQPCVRPAHL